jgi:cell volume regulation protein A
VGLKGAVPITLATFPLLAGIPSASLIFDVVFFVVLVSAVLQGWSLPWVARRLKLDSPPRQEPPVTLEISSLHDVEGDIVDYYVDTDTRAAGRLVKELALPEEVVVALIVRDRQIKLPKGRSKIEIGDHVIVVLHPNVRPMVDRVFAKVSPDAEHPTLPIALEFPLKGSIKVGDLEQFYDIKLGGKSEHTLDEWFRGHADSEEVKVGFCVSIDQIRLCVREATADGHVVFVGMTLLPVQSPDRLELAETSSDGETPGDPEPCNHGKA